MKKIHKISAVVFALAGTFLVNTAAVASVIDFSGLQADINNSVSPTVGGLTFSDSQQYIMPSAYGPSSYSNNILSGVLSNASNDSRFLTITAANGGEFSLESFLAARNNCCSFDNTIIATGFFANGTTSTLSFSNLTFDSYQDEVLNWTGLNSVQLKSGAAFGGYYAFQSFNSTAGVPPVPEPKTYALMLTGLGAIGFLIRRRKTA